jgi:hypothetical protein
VLEFSPGKTDKQVTEKIAEKTYRKRLKEIVVQGQSGRDREKPDDEDRVLLDCDTEV